MKSGSGSAPPARANSASCAFISASVSAARSRNARRRSRISSPERLETRALLAALAGSSFEIDFDLEGGANFVVNTGQATARDIRALVDAARGAVQERFGVVLRDEVVYLGAF